MTRQAVDCQGSSGQLNKFDLLCTAPEGVQTPGLVAGRDHGPLLAQSVLLEVLAGSTLNAAQAEVCLNVLKSCRDGQLPASLLTLTSRHPGWGELWNEHTASVMQCLVKLSPIVRQVGSMDQTC